jgi:IS30 family transposase
VILAERRLKVLEMIRQKKTEREIADVLKVHYNTVCRDVKWLKENIVYDWTLITNEVLDELHSRIQQMKDKDLVAFFGKLVPQRIEQKTEMKGEMKIETSRGEEVEQVLRSLNSTPKPENTS